MNHRTTSPGQFAFLSRILHWLMAAMVLAMLFIGVAMVTSLMDYHRLVSIHRPLGIAILILVVIRFVNRLINPPPPFLATMSSQERFAATATEYLLYGLMFVLPLVGWECFRRRDIRSCCTAHCTCRRFCHTIQFYTRVCGRRTRFLPICCSWLSSHILQQFCFIRW